MDYNKNYYQELNIDKNATQDEIKKAYRKLAHKYHPDKNKSDKTTEEKFKNVSEANSILSDKRKKHDYDHNSPNGNSYSPNPFGGMFGGGQGFEFHFSGGDTIFEQFFSKNNPFGGFNPFQQEEFIEELDINISKNINLKEVYNNEKITLKYNKNVSCKDCRGTGFDSKSEAYICEVCNGSGIYKNSVCQYCKGDGQIYTEQCNVCKGEKVINKESEVIIQNVSQIRKSVRNIHRGYGHQSKYYSNKVGSLILNIFLDRNDNYEIINNFELHKTINLHFQNAINGINLKLKHIDDSEIDVKIPEKTKDGDTIVIKEKGLLINNDQRSDLYLKINIIINYDKI